MRVAQTKVDLVGISRAEWSTLMLTLECVPDDVAEKLDADGRSIKDVVARWRSGLCLAGMPTDRQGATARPRNTARVI